MRTTQVSLARARDVSAAEHLPLKLLRRISDEFQQAIWKSVLERHRHGDGGAWRVIRLDRKTFLSLSASVKRGNVVGIGMMTTEAGHILHHDLTLGISSEVIRRTVASHDRCE